MKTIGLIGGLSWQSTIDYYRFMNLEVGRRTKGKHEAKVIIDSVDFAEVEAFMQHEDFAGITALLVDRLRDWKGRGRSAHDRCQYPAFRGGFRAG